MITIQDVQSDLIGKYSTLGNRKAFIKEVQPGDTVSVQLVKSKSKKRKQTIKGVCISVSRKGLGSTFVIRRLMSRYMMDQMFYFYSPFISNIQVLRKGRVRSSKLYRTMKLS